MHHTEKLSGIQTDELDLRWNIISQKLSYAGYPSVWFGKGHTGYLSMKHMPTGRGFTSFTGFLGGAQSYTASDRCLDTAQWYVVH